MGATEARAGKVMRAVCVRCGHDFLTLHCSKRGEAGVLVQNLNFVKTDATKQVELKHQRPRCVFFRDVIKHRISIRLVLERGEILPISRPLDLLHCGDRALDQIENPNGTSRPQCFKKLLKDCVPL